MRHNLPGVGVTVFAAVSWFAPQVDDEGVAITTPYKNFRVLRSVKGGSVSERVEPFFVVPVDWIKGIVHIFHDCRVAQEADSEGQMCLSDGDNIVHNMDNTRWLMPV